ncbi:FAD-binding oxidoreductase [Mycobacterium fragae]|uniref:Amino acid dehydrogenase n=1 Tax=Mycobacterium fragae TaxID=1260918 RepID=A0A1X1UQU6_9MYCO|nr:FAD-dependent oxidoreductase [Mycobacterium fragae]MCV7401948.1 FAD-binding oxidoreductase [Mycobacterium fragae]ORV59235.1 amino acid dehydrogenase [Mycobacterium fragae]
MVGVERIDEGPRSAIVVGAGIVGLSTAWFLQERGVEVTVVDRTGVAAGASWGNGGWIAPGLTFPPNSPGVLRHGLRALRTPSAPWRSSWRRAMRANAALNEDCIEAFDVLLANGVDAPVTDAPITAVFRSTAEAEHMLWQLRQLENAGQKMYVTALSGEALSEQVPLASPTVTAGLNINGQRFVDPHRFVEALGRSVVERGATMRRLEISEVVSSGAGVTLRAHREALTGDVAVIATGARLSALAGRWLCVPVQASCGYSFTVPADRPIPSPIYLPSARLACTPYQGAVRVSGTMEFRHRHEPVLPQRVEAIIASASPLLDGMRWAEHSAVWIGAYSVTSDGRPLIGEVSPGIYVAGGHGMWGLAHGPVTGRLLAEQITTGKQPQALAEFDPLRRNGRRYPDTRGRRSQRNFAH